VKAYSEWADGIWTVIFVRALNTNDNRSDTPLDGIPTGTSYTFNFGVFDDHVSNRRHHVTFPFTIGNESTTATIKARAQN
jgi:hypothetical protein